MYECEYWHQKQNGAWTIRTKPCRFGCCGDLDYQRCCSANVVEVAKESHLWQTVAGIVIGLLLLTIFVLMVVCAIKKKNTSRARVNDRRSRETNSRPSNHFSALESPALPPYSPSQSTQYNVFILRNNGESDRSALEPAGNAGEMDLPPTYSEESPHPPPAYSSLG